MYVYIYIYKCIWIELERGIIYIRYIGIDGRDTREDRDIIHTNTIDLSMYIYIYTYLYISPLPL